MLILGESEQLGEQGNLGAQREGVIGGGTDGVVQPGGRPRGRIDDLPTEVRALSGHHILVRHTVGVRKDGAQRFVAGQHIRQRRTQRAGIEPPA